MNDQYDESLDAYSVELIQQDGYPYVCIEDIKKDKNIKISLGAFLKMVEMITEDLDSVKQMMDEREEKQSNDETIH